MKDLIRVKRAASILGISTGWVYLKIKEGEIRTTRDGGKVYVYKEDIDKLLNSDKAPSPRPRTKKRGPYKKRATFDRTTRQDTTEQVIQEALKKFGTYGVSRILIDVMQQGV